MLNAPEPSYNYRVNELVDAYKSAVSVILAELERADISDMSRNQSAAMLAEVSRVLSELNAETNAWVEENIPLAAREGTARAIFNLGYTKSFEEAAEIAKFNRLNQNLVAAVIADTQSDLLAVTQNINRRVRGTVRKVVAESMRANMAAGLNGRRTIRAEILKGLRKELGDAVNSAIVDAAGRKWKPEVYAEMITRTKMLETYREATTNEAVSREAFYAVISRHGAKDACRFHEGRIIRLTPEAPGNYPTYEELKASGQIWHPSCKHVFSVIRDVEKLPESIRQLAEKQSELGDKAMKTGKRNPTDIE
ncbi:phage minor capsid protein [Sutcliffiella horikoshii]|uniref:phage minor capsid protein n=1 Tax=Sutcliffiella horikoshii TaxID=79883 RepID=UPI00384EFBD2